MKHLLCAALACSVAGVAHAQVPAPTFSASLGYHKKDDSGLEAIQGRVGARFHRYFGVEGEAALGIEPNTDVLPSVPPLTIKTQLRHELAAYAVGYLPLSPNAELFARVGYGAGWFKRTLTLPPQAAAFKFDEDSVNLGVGAQYYFDGKNGLRLDYTRQDYGRRVGEDDTWSVAFTRRF